MPTASQARAVRQNIPLRGPNRSSARLRRTTTCRQASSFLSTGYFPRKFLCDARTIPLHASEKQPYAGVLSPPQCGSIPRKFLCDAQTIPLRLRKTTIRRRASCFPSAGYFPRKYLCEAQAICKPPGKRSMGRCSSCPYFFFQVLLPAQIVLRFGLAEVRHTLCVRFSYQSSLTPARKCRS